ncbi:MAG: energy transducer TonB, partial [Bdellovibrionales bacterium]|nr:energy transducer TonB [Bdellovibrionales bacterium]
QKPVAIEPIIVDIVLPQPPRKTKPSLSLPPQIVSEPESKVSQNPPEHTRFLAEHNRTTEKEQIKRGLPDAGPSVGTTQQQPPQQDATITPQKASTKNNPSNTPQKLTHLRLGEDELSEKFGSTTEKPTPPPLSSTSQITPLSGYRAFSRPLGSGARFLGNPGSADHLPNLPDGDITLLNAKAARFAVFVRRVATQVFSKLRSTGWSSLRDEDIHGINDFSTVRAILSPQGDILRVELLTPSGSRSFDRVVSEAVTSGAHDPHPPQGAQADDGTIRFVFKARSWSRMGPSLGGAGIAEHRWLLLATGLE